MVNLHLICGFLGAGKSTFSKKLAQEKNGVHLNPDEWCIKLFAPSEYEKNWDICFAKTLDILWDKAEEYLKSGTDVIFDMGFWSKQSRFDAYQKATEYGAQHILYYIYAPDAVLKSRLAQRHGAIAEHNLVNFYQIKELFEEPQADEAFIKIDNF